MHKEKASEVFTYIGQAPEPTLEEKERLKKELKSARKNLKWHDERIRRGLDLNGMPYKKSQP
ncbi:MAG: hypothetical protein RBQ94_07165 [Methanimicrococcus sp.]|nr:hypothetical protein [Methanimicrococcus sp.]